LLDEKGLQMRFPVLDFRYEERALYVTRFMSPMVLSLMTAPATKPGGPWYSVRSKARASVALPATRSSFPFRTTLLTSQTTR